MATVIILHKLTLEQYNSELYQLILMLEEDVTGKLYLVICGIEDLGDLIADYILTAGSPSRLNPQFIQLRGVVQTWLGNGTTGNALDAFRTAFGFSANTSVSGITNVCGTAGISLISGIDAQNTWQEAA